MTWEPSVGLHADVSDADYHSQSDWLSSSGAKYLVPPSTPAHFRAYAENGRAEKRHYDIGHVTHQLVLGKGADFEVITKVTRDKQVAEAEDLKAASARQHVAEIRAAGRVPILRPDLDEAKAMAAAVLANRVAAALFSNGAAEVSAFWEDEATGVKCRARFDWLPDPIEGRRLIVPDLKTAASASRSEFARQGGKFRYHFQDAWYCDALKALGVDPDPAFLFVVVEKGTRLVNILPWAPEARKRAAAMADRTRRIYRECSESGDWYGYVRDGEIGEPVDTPAYITYPEEDFIA